MPLCPEPPVVLYQLDATWPLNTVLGDPPLPFLPALGSPHLALKVQQVFYPHPVHTV